MRVTSSNFSRLGDPSFRLLHGSAFRALGALAQRDSVGGLRLFSTCRLAQWLWLSRDRSFPCPWRFGAGDFPMPSALCTGGLFYALGASAWRGFPLPSAWKVFSMPSALWRGGTFDAFGALRGRSFPTGKK